MSQWREVHIKFDAPDNKSKEKLVSFMDSFIKDHPRYLDPTEADFRVFGWIGKWDERTLSIHEDEMRTALAGFENQVLPFFEQLNSAIPGVSYEGELVRIDNGGEYSKQTRKVSFDGAQFTTDVDYWFEDEGELYEPSVTGPQKDAFQSCESRQSQVGTDRASAEGNVGSEGIVYAIGEISNAQKAESFLQWLEGLVSGLDVKPSTLPKLRQIVIDENPSCWLPFDEMSYWGPKYYGMTPARLLKSREILVTGAMRKAANKAKTVSKAKKLLPADAKEAERILDALRERFAHEVRPANLRDLASANPDLNAHMSQVKRYVAGLGYSSTVKYFEEEGFISKCAMGGSLARPDGDVIEQYHSDSRMTKEGLLALAPDARFVEFDTVCMVYEDEGEPEAYEMLRVGDYLDVVVKWLPELGREPDGLPYGRIHFHFCGHDLGIIKYQDQIDHLSIVGCAGKPEAYGTVGGRVFAQVTGLANGKKAPRVPVHVLYAVYKGWTGAAATVDSGASAGAASRYSYPTGSARPQPVIERRPSAALADPSELYASVSEHRFSYGGERGFEYTFWLPEGGEADDLAIANSYLRALEY